VNGYRATLPPIARDPLDDIREALCRFDAKQAGRSDITYADLSEEMAAVLRAALRMLTRRPELQPWKRLQLEAARACFYETKASRPDGETGYARALGGWRCTWSACSRS